MARKRADEIPATRIGNDDVALAGEVELRVRDRGDGDRVAWFMPAAARRATPAQEAVIIEMQDRVRANIAILRELDELVDRARESGMSWDLIGWSTGMTGPGARKRWGVNREQ